ncbi:hypothetical protein HY251_00005, partial [bacterium]|nr:hypothetical protein [bacterium]
QTVEIIARLSSERTRLKGELEQARSQRDEAVKEAAALRATLATREDAAPAIATPGKKDELEDLGDENVLLASRGVELLQARDTAEFELTRLRAELAEKAAEREELSRLRSEQAESARDREELARARAELAARAAEHDGITKERDELARRGEELARERAELEPRAELRDELVRLRMRVAELEHESGRASALEERLGDAGASLEALERALEVRTREKTALEQALAAAEGARNDLLGVKAALEEAEREARARASALEEDAAHRSSSQEPSRGYPPPVSEAPQPVAAMKPPRFEKTVRFVAIGFGGTSEPTKRAPAPRRQDEVAAKARPYPSLEPAPRRAAARTERALRRIDRRLARMERARVAAARAREASLLEKLESAVADLSKQTEQAAARTRAFDATSETASAKALTAPRANGAPAPGGFLANLIAANLELQKGPKAVSRASSTNVTRSTEL